MTYTGTMKVHYNKSAAAPLVWCVSVDDLFELCIASVVINAPAHAVYRPKATPDDDDGKPSAWFEVHGTLKVSEGRVAIIDRAPSEDVKP